MFPFRSDHSAPEPAWCRATVCNEFHASGLELRLIDLVELRDRSERAGFDDVDEIQSEIDEVQRELAEISAAPVGGLRSTAA